MERIAGLENMNCEEIILALSAVLSQAAADADDLRADIDKSYKEREAAAGQMHAAAEVKNMKDYRENRLKYDMLTEYIGNAERRLDELEHKSVLDTDDVLLIRNRMYDECERVLINGAVEIDQALKSVESVQLDAARQIGRRNAVLLKLHECIRKESAPDIYKDVVIAPFVRALKMFRNQSGSPSFEIFLKNNR